MVSAMDCTRTCSAAASALAVCEPSRTSRQSTAICESGIPSLGASARSRRRSLPSSSSRSLAATATSAASFPTGQICGLGLENPTGYLFRLPVILRQPVSVTIERRRTGIEPADGAKRRPPVLKTGGPTRYPDASGGEPYQVLRYSGQLRVQRRTLTFGMKKSISQNGRLLSRQNMMAAHSRLHET
jgi:hypothetical protein